MSPSLEAQIFVYRFQVLQRNTPFIVLGSLLVAAALVWILLGTIRPVVLWTWSALLLVHSAARLGFWWWLRRRALPEEHDLQRHMAIHVALSLTSGLLWGGGALWLFESPSLEHQLLITFMLAGMVTSSLHSQTAYLPAFHAFFIPCAVAGVACNLKVGGAMNQAVALAVFAYCVLAVRFARTLNHNFTEAWSARFEITDLVQRLQVQKEAAEEANLAKSRFLAAASHDLRQPVHALSLFIGSLSRRPLACDDRELVGHAQDAVQSMEAMFGALLDMSRLDAGVVQVACEPVALRPLVQRLMTEHRAQAQAKGLQWRWRAQEVWVWSDPLKLERILRNLLTNAIRYTDRGGVLLGCRHRGGALQLQIWDTGCGIATERQGELFHEFVQLQPSSPHRQGLGLGLAIVKRLAGLLDHRVLLASRPGQGSMFGLMLPRCEAPVLKAKGYASGDLLQPADASSPCVLVLDDDASIRTGLAVLLRDQGFEVLAAGDLEAMRRRLNDIDSCPALIITDHGLGAAQTGLEVIDALREEFNVDIPAIVVTGNTSPELLQAVSRAGHPLLHKPVSAEALLHAVRALVGTAPNARAVPVTAMPPGPVG